MMLTNANADISIALHEGKTSFSTWQYNRLWNHLCLTVKVVTFLLLFTDWLSGFNGTASSDVQSHTSLSMRERKGMEGRAPPFLLLHTRLTDSAAHGYLGSPLNIAGRSMQSSYLKLLSGNKWYFPASPGLSRCQEAGWCVCVCARVRPCVRVCTL